MRIARIAMMAIAFCAASASIASAQRPDSASQGGRRMGPNLLEGITLTDQQQAQVTAIREKYAPQRMAIMATLRSTGVAPDSTTRAKLQGITDAQTADIRVVLTAEQQQILDKNVVQARERMAKRPPPPAN